MKRIILSLGAITFVAALAVGASGAFFSDTQTSSANTFAAGDLKLTVDSTAHYAGLVCKLVDSVTYHWVQDGNQTVTRPDLLNQPCNESWALTSLGPTNQFFNYSDVKPGDPGENTISLHTTNDAWMCANLKVTSNADGAGGGSVVSNYNTAFEPPFIVGNINGQFGWSKTGPYDAAVVATGGTPASFGTQSLRISDSVTSGSFGDQTISPSVANEAGETAAVSGGFSGGVRQNNFQAQFDIASVLPTLQAGLHVSVSPDRGDGSRMSYLRFEDQADGIHVFFDDVTDAGGVGTVAAFNETDIATISRAPHTIKFAMNFVDGPANDVVRIYIDGVLKKTGTSWEDYYRFDPEQTPSGNKVPTVDSLIFVARGTAVSADAGNGFLFDNVALSSGSNLSGGALAGGIQFATWVDNSTTNGGVPGDNIHQADEPLTSGPAALGTAGTTTLPLADSTHGSAFSAASTHYVGIAWCAGTMTVNGGNGAISCDGSTMGNEAQNDSMTADVTLFAEQSRNNPNFTCAGARSQTIIVNSDSLASSAASPTGWFLYNDQTDTIQTNSAGHQFVTGPSTPPAGSGSLDLTKTTTDKFGIATNQYIGTHLSTLTSLTYSTYRTSGTTAQAPSLGFDIDSNTTDGDTSYQGRLTYEPYFTHTVNTGSWQTWNTQDNAGTGNWWFSHANLSGGLPSQCTQANPCTWSEMLAAYPNIAISGRVVLRTNGADNEVADMNADNFTIGISGSNTTYDFGN